MCDPPPPEKYGCLPLSSPFHRPYTDPMYNPYVEKKYTSISCPVFSYDHDGNPQTLATNQRKQSNSSTLLNKNINICKVSPYKSSPPYPIVDPGRLRLGEGIRYRSQADGIVMPDFVMGPNQIAYPKPQENNDFFYTRKLFNVYPVAGESGATENQCKLFRNPPALPPTRFTAQDVVNQVFSSAPLSDPRFF